MGTTVKICERVIVKTAEFIVVTISSVENHSFKKNQIKVFHF